MPVTASVLEYYRESKRCSVDLLAVAGAAEGDCCGRETPRIDLPSEHDQSVRCITHAKYLKLFEIFIFLRTVGQHTRAHSNNTHWLEAARYDRVCHPRNDSEW